MRSQALYRLFARDMREITVLIGSLTVVFAGAMLIGAAKNPLNAASANGIALAASVSMISTMQFVQALILKEKASGAFLLLRSLPVTNDEIALAKILAVCAGTEIAYLLLLAAIFIFLKLRGIPTQPLIGWVILWSAAILLVIAVTSAGAALAYDQKRAMVIPPIAIGSIVLLFAGIAKLTGPAFWTRFVVCRAEVWGLLILAALILLCTRVSLRLFNRRDFVQLIE